MTVEVFFELFLKELELNPNFSSYYKFLNNTSSFQFRKAHFCQRLEFIARQVKNKQDVIWDCGCGYGTTAIFLALNGYRSHGSTLEFYYNEIPKRIEYWSQFGDMSLFTVDYENIFDKPIPADSYDIIIVQDTLHHLEPLGDAIKIFRNALRKNGRILVSEVNGDNLFERAKFYKQRGNKRVIQIYDEKLDKHIWFGNENIRPYPVWVKAFNNEGLNVLQNDTEFIRLFPPFFYKDSNYKDVIAREQRLWRKNGLLRKYFFFGVNFVAQKA